MNKKDLAKELKQRGLIAQEGGGDLEEILKSKRKIYMGVDPTADSIHMGHLVPIILIKHLYNHGHEPYLLVGGATGLIGDPKDTEERPFSDSEVIAQNTRNIKKQLSRVLDKDELVVFDNSEWLGKVRLIDFLRDIGKHFSVNQLIKRDIIKRRLETEENSISFTEFSYSLLQAYDYMYLNEKHGIDLQVGGSDQWANIISGVDLVRRKKNKTVYALTTPIITDKATGKKFGKSEGNAVWLDPKKTSPFDFYQFWINVSDDNVEEYIKIFSFLSLSEIEGIIKEHKSAPHKRKAQRLLAKDVTGSIHGEDVADSVEKVSDILYGGDVKNVPSLSKRDKDLILKEASSYTLTKEGVKEGVSITDALRDCRLVSSKAEARRAVDGGGVSVNGEKVNKEFVINEKHFQNGLVFIKKGKKIGVVSV
ncbi:MAG: tyrosine--tRNA ligase [Patescibacteria group bacterium]